VISSTFLDWNDLVSDQTMRFAVYGRGGFLSGGLDEAKDFATALVEPILQILDPIFGLHLKITLVCAGDRLGGQSIHVLVNV